jgi:hypothetical protein
MISNPFIAVFPYRRRRFPPRIGPRERTYIARALKAQPEGVRLVGRMDAIRWQDRRGRWSAFSPRKTLRGVLVLSSPPRVKPLTRSERLTRQRRRVSARRSRVRRWLEQHLHRLRRLTALARRYPAHRARYAALVYPPEGVKGTTEWSIHFARVREIAMQLGGAALRPLEAVVEAYRLFDEAVERAVPGVEWLPTRGVLYPILERYGVSPLSLQAAMDLIRTKFIGADPAKNALDLIRVVGGSTLNHPPKSANLLMLPEPFSEAALDAYTTEAGAMLAICRLSKPQSHLVDTHQRFVKSPDWPSQAKPMAFYRREPEGKFTVLPCPIIYRRRMAGDMALSYRALHDFLFAEARSRYDRLLTQPGGREKAAEAIRRGEVLPPQEVWKEIYQRTYWKRKVYVTPIYFLGYTPRGGARETGSIRPR